MTSRLNPPNIITGARILACPLVWMLVMAPGPGARLGGFVLFLAAALSDLWDGYLARRYGWITDVGKLLDPLADKLLLIVSFVPIYILSHRPGDELPFVGSLPLWIVILIFGREAFITGFRWWAARQGVVIAAGTSGKYKALFQNFFAGGALLWFPIQGWVIEAGATGAPFWSAWRWIHGGWLVITLAVAVVLTIWSLIDYLRGYGAPQGGIPEEPGV